MQITEEPPPPPYSPPRMNRQDSFENPLAGRGSQSFGSQEEERTSSGNPQSGTALYDFSAGGDDEVVQLIFQYPPMKFIYSTLSHNSTLNCHV